MTRPGDHPDEKMRSTLKGLKLTLAEWGIIVEGMRLQCKDDVNLDTTLGLVYCCVRHYMALHDDFRSQKSIFEENITGVGFLSYFYPDFHCEWARLRPTGAPTSSTLGLSATTRGMGLSSASPRALPMSSLRLFGKSFVGACITFNQSYSYGWDYELTKFAHKRYKSHRRIPMPIWQGSAK